MQDLAFPYAELYSWRKKVPDPPPVKKASTHSSRYRLKDLASKVSSRESLYQHEKSFLPGDMERNTRGFLFHSIIRSKHRHRKLEPSQTTLIPKDHSPPPEALNWKTLLLQTERILGSTKSTSTGRSNSLMRTRFNSRTSTAVPTARTGSKPRLKHGLSADQVSLKLTGQSQKLITKVYDSSSSSMLSNTLHLDLSQILGKDEKIKPPLVTLKKKRRDSLDKNFETESDLLFDDRMEARYG
mmetsp:Transcript_27651/g.49926  ORF Transcript_27651/g.49926 Transcript_27651/m.49926 type:complete len:241 (-) Transcript_27651:27-749(-)